MPLPPLSKTLHELLQEQHREAQRLERRHRLAMDKEDQRWRQQQRATQQQQHLDNQTQRRQQTDSRDILSQLAKTGAPGSLIVQRMQLRGQTWQKFTPQQQQLLQGAAAQGATGAELARLLQSDQQAAALQKQQLHKRTLVADRQGEQARRAQQAQQDAAQRQKLAASIQQGGRSQLEASRQGEQARRAQQAQQDRQSTRRAEQKIQRQIQQKLEVERQNEESRRAYTGRDDAAQRRHLETMVKRTAPLAQLGMVSGQQAINLLKATQAPGGGSLWSQFSASRQQLLQQAVAGGASAKDLLHKLTGQQSQDELAQRQKYRQDQGGRAAQLRQAGASQLANLDKHLKKNEQQRQQDWRKGHQGLADQLQNKGQAQLANLDKQLKKNEQQRRQNWGQQHTLLSQQLQVERQTQAQQHQQQRDRLQHFSQQKLNGKEMLAELRKNPQQWQKFTQAQQKVLQRVAARGGSGADMLKVLDKIQDRERQKLAGQHQQQRATEANQHSSLLNAPRSVFTRRRQQMGERHRDERHEQREQEAAAKKRQKEETQKRQHFKSAGMSFLRGDLQGAIGHGLAGIGGPIGTIGTAAMAAFQGVTKLEEKITDFATIANNSALKIQEKGYLMTRRYIPGAAATEDMLFALAGGEDVLMQQQRKALQAGATISFLGNQERRRAFIQSQQHVYQYRGEELKRAGADVAAYGRPLLAIDRTTYQGEREYQFAQIRYRAQTQVAHAEAEARAARRSHEEAGRYAANSQGAFNMAQNRYLNSLMRLEEARETPAHLRGTVEAEKERNAALIENEKAYQDMLEKRKTLTEAINRDKELGISASEAEARAEKAKLSILKAEIDVRRNKEQLMSSTAQTLGTMHPAQRAIAMASLKMAKNVRDLGMLPPMMQQYARQIAPQEFQKLAERSGLRTREFKQLQQMGAIDKGDLDQIRNEIRQKEIQLDIKLELNPGAMATAVADKMGTQLTGLINAFANEFEKQIKEIERKFNLGQYQRNAGAGGR